MNSFRVFLFLFLVCSFTSHSISQVSQSTVRGVVKDSSGDLVAGAVVKAFCPAAPREVTTVSDKDGSFSFWKPVGNCRFRASLESGGFTLFSEIVAWDGKDLSLKISRSSAIAENVDVKIEDGESVRSFERLAKTVSVVSSSELRARNESNLTDTLRTIPGFRVQQLGGPGRTASIKTRGLRNQDTAVLLDGQRLRDVTAISGDASAFISDLNTVSLGKVEVLRGSGSSIYGTNAIGGVIDLQTRRAGAGFNGDLFTEFGGLGYSRFQGEGAYGSDDGRWGITAGVSRYRLTEGIDGEDDADNLTLRTRFDGTVNSSFVVGGRLLVSDSFVRLNGNPDTLGVLPAGIIDARQGVNFTVDANDPDNFQRSDFLSGQIFGLFLFPDDRSSLKVSYQGLDTSRENENGGLGPGFQPFGGTQFSFFDGQAHTLNATFETSFDVFRLVGGYEYELERFANRGVGPTSTGDFSTEVDQGSNTFFVHGNRYFTEYGLQLAGGFRVQQFSLDNPVFSVTNPPYSGLSIDSPPVAYTFDGSGSYFFKSTGTKLRAHVGNGYRVPSLFERFGTFFSSFSQSFTALGDPNLEPERSVSFDAGIDQRFSYESTELTFSATYFYTEFLESIGFANVAPPIGGTTRPFGGYFNTDGGVSRGAEFSVYGNLHKMTSMRASYTYTNSDNAVSPVAGSGILSAFGVPENAFTFNLIQGITRNASVAFDYEATSSYLAPIFSNSSFTTEIYRFDGVNRADLTGRYGFPVWGERSRLNLFFSVENLFDTTYFENGFATRGITARGGLGVSF